jgi:hypothetical protein
VRLELFGRYPAPADAVRSATQRIEFDCKGGRQRVLSATAYPGANLEGAGVAGPGRGWEKIDPAATGGSLLRQLCSQRSLFGPVGYVAMPTPLRGSAPADVEAWIADHIVPDQYVLSGHTDQAAALYSTTEIERTRQDYMRVWTRLEYFRPNPLGDRVVRSMRTLVEFDCDQHRSRTLATEVFPGSNLIGDKAEEKTSRAEWSFISPQALLSYVASDVCRRKDEATGDPAKALPSGNRQAR